MTNISQKTEMMPRPRPSPLLLDISEKRSQNSFRFKTPFKTPSSQASEISVDKIHAINSPSSPSTQLSDESGSSAETIINPNCQQTVVTDNNYKVDVTPSYASATYGSSMENIVNFQKPNEYPRDDTLTKEISNKTHELISTRDENSNEDNRETDLEVGKNSCSAPRVCSLNPYVHGASFAIPENRSAPVITKTYARKPVTRKFKVSSKQNLGDSNVSESNENNLKKENKLITIHPVETPVMMKMRNKLRLIALIEEFAKEFRKVKKRYDFLKARREASEKRSQKRTKDQQQSPLIIPLKSRCAPKRPKPGNKKMKTSTKEGERSTSKEWERGEQMLQKSSTVQKYEGGSPKKSRKTMTSSLPEIENGGDERGTHFSEE